MSRKIIYRISLAVLLAVFSAVIFYLQYEHKTDGAKSYEDKDISASASNPDNSDIYDIQWGKIDMDEFKKTQIKKVGEKVTFRHLDSRTDLIALKCDIYDSIPDKYMYDIKNQRKMGVDDYLFSYKIPYEEFEERGLMLLDLTMETSLSYPDYFIRSGGFSMYVDNKLIGNPTLIFTDNLTFLDMNGRYRIEPDEFCGAFTFEGENKVFHMVYVCKKEDYETKRIAIANYDPQIYEKFKDRNVKGGNHEWQIVIRE